MLNTLGLRAAFPNSTRLACWAHKLAEVLNTLGNEFSDASAFVDATKKYFRHSSSRVRLWSVHQRQNQMRPLVPPKAKAHGWAIVVQRGEYWLHKTRIALFIAMVSKHATGSRKKRTDFENYIIGLSDNAAELAKIKAQLGCIVFRW